MLCCSASGGICDADILLFGKQYEGESNDIESLEMISTRSPLAVLFASVVVLASGEAFAVDNATMPKAPLAPTKLRASVKQAWLSAIANDNAARLLQLIQENEPKELLPLTASNGKSALMVAAKKGDMQLVETLVGFGANVNEMTETQGTPFMFAILGNHKDIAQWLLDRGADVNTVGSNGWTALTIAAAKGQVRLLQWLIEQDAATQVRDVYRFTPLMRAVSNGHLDAAAVLLSLVETDVDARDEYDNTSLHHAVLAGDVPMVNLLLEHHAKTNLINRAGESASQMARELADDSAVIMKALDEAAGRSAGNLD